MQKYYFNVYLKERRYGGPEEGGWFYTWYEFQTTLESRSLFSTSEEACGHAADLTAKIREDQEPIYHMGNGPDDGINEAGEGDDRYLLPGGSWGEDEVLVSAELLPGKEGYKPGIWDWTDDTYSLPVPVPQQSPSYE